MFDFPLVFVDLREQSERLPLVHLSGTSFAIPDATEDRAMSLVRLLGFRTLSCGCVIGRYRELATSRELTYVEEKGSACDQFAHRRNHTINVERAQISAPQFSARAS